MKVNELHFQFFVWVVGSVEKDSVSASLLLRHVHFLSRTIHLFVFARAHMSSAKEKRASEKLSFRRATGNRKRSSQGRGVASVVSTCVQPFPSYPHQIALALIIVLTLAQAC
jgi:hypothetical protein